MDAKKKGVITGKTKETKKQKGKELRDPMFVGVDPSYNGFGIIVLDKTGNIIEQKLLKSDSKKEVEERIIELQDGFKFISNILSLHCVYIEGPSYSSQGAFMLQMGALHFFLRIFLLEKGVNYQVVTPGSLKKFVSGSGVAKKELMLLKTYKKWGVEFEDNNLCDAYGLARMALEDFDNGDSFRS